jgi:tight adherence protein B
VTRLQLIGIFVMVSTSVWLLEELVTSRQDMLAFKRHASLVATTGKTFSATKQSQFGAAFDKWVRLSFAVGVRYSWGMRLGAVTLLAVAGISATGGWLFAYRTFGHSIWIAALVSAAAFFVIPRRLLVRQQRRIERDFIERFPNSIDMVVRMLRAGLPISAAVRTLETDTQPPLNLVFGSLADQIALGVPFERALDIASERIGLPDFRFFAIALNLQSATGGNLTTTLEGLADVIRKRRALRLKAAAATAEVRVSAYVLGALPFITIGALLFFQPEYVRPLFYDVRGKYILGSAAVLLVLAYLTMRQMVRKVTSA